MSFSAACEVCALSKPSDRPAKITFPGSGEAVRDTKRQRVDLLALPPGFSFRLQVQGFSAAGLQLWSQIALQMRLRD